MEVTFLKRCLGALRLVMDGSHNGNDLFSGWPNQCWAKTKSMMQALQMEATFLKPFWGALRLVLDGALTHKNHWRSWRQTMLYQWLSLRSSESACLLLSQPWPSWCFGCTSSTMTVKTKTFSRPTDCHSSGAFQLWCWSSRYIQCIFFQNLIKYFLDTLSQKIFF